MVFTDYKGLKVSELTELRNVLKGSSLEYHVVKNTLARIASADTSVSVAAEFFKGPVGVALGYDDPVTVVKQVLDFAKKNEKLKVRAGVVEGSVCSQDDLKAIASLPSRDVLLSMMAGTLQAPTSKLAAALNATVVGLAYALESLKTKKSS